MADELMLNRRTLLAVSAAGLVLPGCATARPSGSDDQIVWTFDRLTDIGGVATTAEGAPTLVDSPWGQAAKFDGVDDGLFIDRHPLAGAETWTIEALFRPDGGAFEQRFMHLAETEFPKANEPAVGTRFLFEIRVVENEWYLDAFTKGPTYNHTLIFPEKRFPVGRWYHVAQTYDGATYRSFVDGVLQGEAPLAFTPQGPGRSSVGVRMNKVSWFNGAIREARFTPRGLTPDQFTRPS
ncbi:MAG: LamG domain-containing protein [Brevundimonas sp.]|nr:MAG: LamG domain-containing protein [Brevundimonas sp.]